MKIDDELNIGDVVWVYDPPCKPRLGVIDSEIFSGAYNVKFQDKGMEHNERRVWSYFKLFKWPAEWKELVEQLEDDAAGLKMYAEEIERKYRE